MLYNSLTNFDLGGNGRKGRKEEDAREKIILELESNGDSFPPASSIDTVNSAFSSQKEVNVDDEPNIARILQTICEHCIHSLREHLNITGILQSSGWGIECTSDQEFEDRKCGLD